MQNINIRISKYLLFEQRGFQNPFLTSFGFISRRISFHWEIEDIKLCRPSEDFFPRFCCDMQATCM